MSKKATGTAVFSATPPEAPEVVRRALRNVGAAMTSDSGEHFEGRLPASGRSAGEVVLIDLDVRDGQAEAQILSRSAIRSTLIDFGVNGRNVRRLAADLERGAPLTTGQHAFGGPVVDPRLRWIGLPLCLVAAAGAVFAEGANQRALILWTAGVAAVLAFAAPALGALRIRRHGQVAPLWLDLTGQAVTWLVGFGFLTGLKPRHCSFGVTASLAMSCFVGGICVAALVTRAISAVTAQRPRTHQ